MPVFLALRQYSAFLQDNPKGTLEGYLPQFLKTRNLDGYWDLLKDALQRGDAILLLDGLDEVASEEERAKVALQVQQFSSTYKNCRLILTCRKVGYPKAPIKNGLVHFVVKPLSSSEIQTFIDLWCSATETEIEKHNLLEAISNPRVRALAENPLLITILARVYKAYRNLPERRAELYAKCAEALLTTWDLMRDLPPVFKDSREANRIMGPLALWMHRDRGGQFVTKEELVSKLSEIGNLPRGQQPGVVLNQIEERSGLLLQVGLNQYAFTHLTFQEYYVAREIVSSGNCFRHLRRFVKNDRWQEVIILTAGLLDDLGPRPVTEFLDSFLVKPIFPAKATNTQVARFGLLLACLKDKVEPEAHIADYVVRSLIGLAAESRELIIRLIPHLGGLAKTRAGNQVLQHVSNQISRTDDDERLGTLVVLGYQLHKDEPERLTFLIQVVTNAVPSLSFLGNVAFRISDMLNHPPMSASRRAVVEEIRALPLDRRVQILNSLVPNRWPANMLGQVVQIWTAAEERSHLPRELRIKPGGAPAA